MQPDLQLYLLLPRILETFLFAVIIVMVNRPFKKVCFTQRPLLHRLFLVGLYGWLVYIFLDIFIYSLADLSFDPSNPLKVMGYQWAYPSLFFANIARDIAYAGVLTECWAYFFVPIAIRRGEAYTNKILHNKRMVSTIVLISILLILNDNLIVWVSEDKILIMENYEGVGVLSLIIMLTIYFISGVYMFRILHLTVQEDENPEYHQKVRYFSWGILHMSLGFVWSVFWNIMSVFFPIILEPLSFLTLSFIVHILWGASGVLIYKGLTFKSPSKE